MSDFGQHAVGLLVIGAIALIDNFIFVESRVDPTPNDMIWISQSDFATNGLSNTLGSNLTDNDSLPNETPGFWIDTAFVSKAEYQEFVAETGYQGSADVQPKAMLLQHNQSAPMHGNRIYALQEARNSNATESAMQYVSQHDALAFCNWQGMELSTMTQNQIAAQFKHQAPNTSSNATTTAQLAHITGFRCVRIVN